MAIVRVTAWRQDQPFRDGPYVCSGNRVALGFESTIVRIETDDGVTGWGEMSPLGSIYRRPSPPARGPAWRSLRRR